MDHYGPLFSRQAFITYFFIAVTFILPFILIVPTHNFMILDQIVYN